MEAQIGLSSTMSYELREALLVYRSDRQKSAMSSANVAPVFITKHSIQLSTEGAPTMSPGAVLDREDLDTLIKGLRGAVPVEFLPPNVLVRTPESIVWWTPAAIRPMFYLKNKGAELDQLSGKRFPQPPLLFRASAHDLDVRALSRNERPQLDSPLYRAPYWNVYDTGNICLGSTKIPGNASVASLPQWEQSFFESEFTHSNTSSKLTEHPEGFMGLWKSLAGKKSFPVEYLADAKQTLKKFINH